MKLNGYEEANYNYIKQLIKSDRISMGAYQDRKLIATGLIHIDDLSFGGLAVDKQFRRKGIAFKLSQIVLKQHFQQGFDYVITNIETTNTASMGLVEKLGFKKLNSTYYWLQQA